MTSDSERRGQTQTTEYPCAARTFDLRDRAQRKAWARIAYQPRVDYGETDVPLKPNFHLSDDGDMGWMD